jgi:hemerythrin superfamily protein
MRKNSSIRQGEERKSSFTKGLETVAHTVGRVAGLASKTFAGSTTGSTTRDAVHMLKDDHALVQHLFEQFEQAANPREKADIARSAMQELEVHATVEEEIVYPAIRALDDDQEHQDKMDEALEEHHLVKQLIAELQDMRPSNGRYAAKFTVMAESVRHHIEEEEGELLPKAEESELDLETLGERMAARKQELMREMPEPQAQKRSATTPTPQESGSRKSRGVSRPGRSASGKGDSARAGRTAATASRRARGLQKSRRTSAATARTTAARKTTKDRSRVRASSGGKKNRR